MTMNSGFENLERIKKKCQCFNLITHRYEQPKKGNRYTGGVPLFYDAANQKVYVDPDDTHTLVYGATGSLKTRSVVMPTIKLLGIAGESMIINDAKGELYSRLAGELCELGYQIVVINLREPSGGNCWNPLHIPYQFYKNGDIDRACEFVNDIACNLTKEAYAAQDPFWDNSAADLTFALILLLFKYCLEHEEPESAVNISNVLELRRRLFSPENHREPKFTDIWKYAAKDELINASLSGSVFAPNDTRNSILSVFDQKMRTFSIQPTLMEMLSNNDFDIARISQEKSALFLIIPDEKTTYHRLCSLFIKQSYEYLIYITTRNQNKRVDNRVNYCLDEFSSLPSVADFPAMITAARSRDIRFLLVVQSQSSLKKRYAEEAETIVSNCANWIFFTSRELELLRELSELCGTPKNSHTPNISTYELQHFSKENREALVLCGRYKPAKVTMLDIDNPNFSGRKYSVLKIQTSERKKRKQITFDFGPQEEEEQLTFNPWAPQRGLNAGINLPRKMEDWKPPQQQNDLPEDHGDDEIEDILKDINKRIADIHSDERKKAGAADLEAAEHGEKLSGADAVRELMDRLLADLDTPE